MKRLCLAALFLLPILVSCAGGSGTTPGPVPQKTVTTDARVSGALTVTATAATLQAAEAIAQGHASSFPQAKDNDDGISVYPKSLTFTSRHSQTVTVKVHEATKVFAGSEDSRVATVSPSEQRVRNSDGGALTFKIKPRTDDPGATLVCFLTAEWHFGCVEVRIGSAVPSPSPSPPVPFTFNPPSPLHLAGDGFTTVAVSEASYSGQFSVTACSIASSAGGSCATYKNGWACTAVGAATAIMVQFYPASGGATDTTFDAAVAVGPSPPSVSCRFTLEDANGHTAMYTINAP